MTETLNEQLTTEIATVDKDPFNFLFNNLMRPNDATLATRGASKGLRIYDEIERDCHAFSVLQKRKLALISRPVIVEAASNALRDRKARDGVDAFLKSINFDQICLDLLDATLKGFAAAEIMWRVGNGIIDVATIAPKDQRRFVFDKDSMPRLITRSDISQGIALPERKFIIHRYGAKDGNPYGLGLGTRLFWPVFFKRQGIQFWLTFADKFGSPTAVGKYPNGASKPDQDKLLEALSALANDAGVIIPEGMMIEFVEASRSGSVDTYEKLCRYMDEEISKATLGETLSTSMSAGGGSYAASKTHNEVRLELTKADADLLSDTLNATLIKWFCEFNYPGALPPKVARDFSEPEDLLARANTDKTICEMGFKPTLKYIRETYGEGWEEVTANPPAVGDPLLQSGLQPPPLEKGRAVVGFASNASFSETTLPNAQQLIAAGADQLAQEYETILGDRLESLLALLEETQDLALFRDRLAELIADSSMDNALELIKNSRISADLLGKL